MPEPTTTTAAATLIAAGTTVPMLEAFGVSLGLRPDVLIAGFAGALVAIVLLDSVPSEGDTWSHLVRSTVRRIFVALASSITAGYLTPLVLLLSNLPDALLLGVAFTTGSGAQKFVGWVMSRLGLAPRLGAESEGNKP
ncbi:MAG: hypothetical protein ACT6UH_00710 [Hydrogenophaga sp.]|uniref:hypothetical protein n=1 Tax=Hydrogenophaga sp. TaxID=1904254 RepID=UPI004036BFF4